MKKNIIIMLIFINIVGCSYRMDQPAKPQQIEKFQKVLELFPELIDDYRKAESDEIITKAELMAMLDKAKKIKESRLE